MTRLANLVGISLLVAVVCVATAGCATSNPPLEIGVRLGVSGHGTVPTEFRPACGRPGRTVVVRHVPVTVRHADCDLTGVTIAYGHAGALVPPPGEGATEIVDLVAPDGQPTEITVATATGTSDVTVTG
jgi:hypothetical protein